MDPDGVAVESIHRRLTWAQLERESARLAAGYLSIGLEPGDRLASLMPNRVALAVHYLACFKAGLVATPLNYRYTAREIDHALEVSAAAALVAHAERAADIADSTLASSLPRGTIVFHDAPEEVMPGSKPIAADPVRDEDNNNSGWDHRFDDLLAAQPQAPGMGFDPDAPAVILFTSGSTGPAKGVTHTHRSLRWMIASTLAAFELSRNDVFLPASSMSHLGSVLWSLSTLAVGGRVVVARTTDAHELLPLLRDHQPTLMAMIPAALWALIHDHDLRPGDLSSLRLVRSGSDKVSTELLAEFAAAGFPIVEGYGMTEVGLATLNPVSGQNRQGSIGPPIGGFTIALRDEQGDPVGVEQVGRILIKTRSQMSGYWQAPEATAKVIRRLARLRRSRPRRPGRLPVVLRSQEAGDRPRRLQCQSARGRGRFGRAPWHRPRRCRRRPRQGPR